MAVYTVLEREQIETLIKPFGIGPLVDFQGVSEGLENTSYFFSTDHSALAAEELSAPIQHYVLTVFEELTMAELPFYIDLTRALNESGLQVPCPLCDYNGSALQRVAEKPALIFPKISGTHPSAVSNQHCLAMGEALAKMHLLSQTLALNNTNQGISCRGSQWLQDSAEQLSAVLDTDDQALIQQALAPYLALIRKNDDSQEGSALPCGIIHNDLFRDNTLFEGDQLAAIIDFYSATEGYLLIDLAIVVNDWCSKEDGSLDQQRYDALMTAYTQQRPFSTEEKTHWHTVLAVCACRFWMSRLLIQHFSRNEHRQGCLVPHKDPEEYKRILEHHLGKAVL